MCTYHQTSIYIIFLRVQYHYDMNFYQAPLVRNSFMFLLLQSSIEILSKKNVKNTFELHNVAHYKQRSTILNFSYVFIYLCQCQI